MGIDQSDFHHGFTTRCRTLERFDLCIDFSEHLLGVFDDSYGHNKCGQRALPRTNYPGSPVPEHPDFFSLQRNQGFTLATNASAPRKVTMHAR